MTSSRKGNSVSLRALPKYKITKAGNTNSQKDKGGSRVLAETLVLDTVSYLEGRRAFSGEVAGVGTGVSRWSRGRPTAESGVRGAGFGC